MTTPQRASPFAALAAASRPDMTDRLKRFADRGRPAAVQAMQVTGTIESLKMFSDTWGTATMWSEDRQTVKLTGAGVAQLKEGSDFMITGTLKTHPKFGDSIEITSATPHVKLNERSIIKFLVNEFTGIGEKSATKYVTKLVTEGGNEALAAFREKILKEPWNISFELISKKGTYTKEERASTNLAFIQRDLATRLGGLEGIRAPVITALAKRLLGKLPEPVKGAEPIDPVSSAWAMLVKNPYEAIPHVPGFGFLMADVIGREANIPRDAPPRMAALVAHAVLQACEAAGHVFLSEAQARASINLLDPKISAAAALDAAHEEKTISLDRSPIHPDGAVYPYSLLNAEVSFAKLVAKMCEPSQPLVNASKAELEVKLQTAAKTLGAAFSKGLDPSQIKALISIMTSRVRIHTITADPGAGKTAVMEVLAKVLDKSFAFCAPTGKGAKVLSNRLRSLSMGATTIHSMLKGAGPGSFQVNETNQLCAEVVVIDEASMPDLALADAVFRAVESGAHVILLGDPDQLPSISPGRVLQDLLTIPEIDHNRLTSIHRNSGGILDVMREVKLGAIEPVDRPGAKNKPGTGVTFSQTLDDAALDFPGVMARYLSAVARSGYSNVALLMSRKKGEPNVPGWNTTYANAVLREVCNPAGRKVPGTMIFVGDRVLITDNFAVPDEDGEGSESVVNGDTGTVKSFTLDESDKAKAGAKTIRVELDDGRTLDLPGSYGGSLQHAFALTVHKAQGSEYKEVIAVMTPGSPSFVNMNMLVTCLSRARAGLNVYADSVALRKIARTPMPPRNSALVARVAEMLDSDDDVDDVSDALSEVTAARCAQRAS